MKKKNYIVIFGLSLKNPVQKGFFSLSQFYSNGKSIQFGLVSIKDIFYWSPTKHEGIDYNFSRVSGDYLSRQI